MYVCYSITQQLVDRLRSNVVFRYLIMYSKRPSVLFLLQTSKLFFCHYTTKTSRQSPHTSARNYV